MRAATRLDQIEPFRVMQLLARANELAAAGHDVIHLEVGEPDFPTPDPIVAAGVRALQDGKTRYTDARGILELRELISRHYEERFDVSVSPQRIFVTAGASGGLLLLTSLLLNAGDELLMTDPGYPCNRHFLTNSGAKGILVPVDASDNYQLTKHHIDEYWSDKTVGALVASPANPTGAVLSIDDFRHLSEAINRRDGVLIVDEIYQGITYENTLSNTVLQVNDNAFVVNSFSKFFGMTGWRLGWIVVPDSLAVDLEKLAQNLFICPSTVAQHAALSAFNSKALQIMEANRAELEVRRQFLVPALQKLGFDIPQHPAGAFYIYAGLPRGCANAEEFCSELLEQEYVAVTPGTDFGLHDAHRYIRFSYAQSQPRLAEAVERIRKLIP